MANELISLNSGKVAWKFPELITIFKFKIDELYRRNCLKLQKKLNYLGKSDFYKLPPEFKFDFHPLNTFFNGALKVKPPTPSQLSIPIFHSNLSPVGISLPLKFCWSNKGFFVWLAPLLRPSASRSESGGAKFH